MVHNYFFCLCKIYAKIAIKNDFVLHQHSPGPDVALGFQHSPRDLANVNEWKIMFDLYITCVKLTYSD